MSTSSFSRKTVVEQVADAIAQEIASGKISGLMPSIRALADRYQLSVPTLHKARKILMKRGLLVSRGAKRRLSVNRTAAPLAAPVPVQEGTLVVFSGEDPTALPSNVMLPVQSAMVELMSQGRHCVFESLAGLTPVEISRRIASVLSFHKPTHCILLYGTMVMHRQLARAKVKVALIGGTLKPSSYSTRIGVSFPPLIEEAVVKLKQLGHRRFFVPYLRRDLGVSAANAEINDIARRHGVRILVHWSQMMANNVGAMEALLDEAFGSKVTAVLFPQWTDFVFSMGYSVRRDLRVPQDYSVVVLNNVASGFVYRPQVANFHAPSDAVKQLVLGWVRGESRCPRFLSEQMLATWSPGETIGEAPVIRRLQNA